MCYIPIRAVHGWFSLKSSYCKHWDFPSLQRLLEMQMLKRSQQGLCLKETEELKLPEIWLTVKPEFLMQLSPSEANLSSSSSFVHWQQNNKLLTEIELVTDSQLVSEAASGWKSSWKVKTYPWVSQLSVQFTMPMVAPSRPSESHSNEVNKGMGYIIN